MLSYQHIYHAGCLADIHKHTALSVILAQLVKKEKPLYYLETHAGRGLYDLTSEEAKKTGEAEAGILRLRGKISPSHPYRQILDQFGAMSYPGSPLIAHNIMRQNDRLFLMEKHPQEFMHLKNVMGNFRNTFVFNKDGYDEVLAISPPAVRRGMVLVDPSYEMKTEYQQVAQFIKDLSRKWAEAVILLWYPILASAAHEEMCGALENMGLPKFWRQEIVFNENAEKMLGSGLISVNLPYGCEQDLAENANLFTQ